LYYFYIILGLPTEPVAVVAGVIFVAGVYVSAAAALVIAGAVIGVLAVVALGIHREDRHLSLTSDITDRVARGARRVNGVYTRGPGLAHETGRHRHST
jgi:hypothetical protein